MKLDGIIHNLSHTDDLELWPTVTNNLSPADQSAAINMARPLWIERMTNQNRLIFHPKTLADLRTKKWEPSEQQLQMIWANLLVNLEGPSSQESFQRIKTKLKNKYGFDWWEGTYAKIKPIYATRQQIKKHEKELGPTISMLKTNTHYFAEGLAQQTNELLMSLPKL